MKNIHEIISNTPLFCGLPEKQLRDIRSIAVEEMYDTGATIFSEGDDGRGFYVVVTGMVKIFKVSFGGKEQILHILGHGEPFGEVPVFIGQQFPANAEAIVKTNMLFFPRHRFVQLITDNPNLALNMLAVLSMRLRQFTVQIGNLSLKEVPGRLASYLIYMSEESKNDIIDLEISKSQLSSLLGTIPETLSRILTRLARNNLIEVRGRQIRILNLVGLKDIAEHGKRLE